MKRLFCRPLILGSLLLASCGGGTTSVGEFATVFVTPSASLSRLEADVLKGNVCGEEPTDGVFETESVECSLSSKLYSNVSVGSPVVVNRTIVRYEPRTPISPEIETQNHAGGLLAPGGTLSLDVPVLTESLKYNLMTTIQPVIEACSGTIYEYWVYISFDVVELQTGRTGRINLPPFELSVADRI